jgi:4-hydroxybenzoate polyprenyltransferase
VTEAARRPLEKAGALLALCRVSNLPTVWMNVLAAALLADAGATAGDVLLLAAALSASYCGGMCLNDVCDREIDARKRPSRPIPSGRVSPAEARAVAAALLGAGLGLLGLAPHPSAAWPGLALLALIVAYDRLHRRHPSTVLLMAGCRAMVFAVTAWAVADAIPPLVALAGGLQFAYTLAVTAVARHEGTRGAPYPFPLIPRLIASMSLLDGALLAVAVAPAWGLSGAGAAAVTLFGQRYVRGD